MKTVRSLALGAFLLVSITSSAAIITVNNASPSPGQHTTVAAAITAASDGDTIMVAGTDLTYGAFTINKSISLVGPGWTVSGGGISRVAVCGAVTVSVHNVRIEGLRAASITCASGGTQIDNLSVKRCIIDTDINGNSEHIFTATIEGNVFSLANDYNLSNSTASWYFSGCTIRNNIFNGILYNVDNSVIEHNIFLGTAAGAWAISSSLTQGNVFQGNIAIGRNLATMYAGNTISGNLGYSTNGGSWLGAGNINEANPTFVAYTNLAVHNWTNDYHLQGGSPAVGTGPGGDDIGVYDGDGVYRQDGEPSIPIVRAVNVPGGAVVPANATFNVNIISVAHE